MRLTEAVKAGAHGFGEIKFHVEADGRRCGDSMRQGQSLVCR